MYDRSRDPGPPKLVLRHTGATCAHIAGKTGRRPAQPHAARRTPTAAAMEEPPRHEDHEDDAIVARAHARWGPRGWSSNVMDVTVESDRKMSDATWRAGATAVVRVTLADGNCYHEDVGHATATGRDREEALGAAKAAAVKDGKRRGRGVASSTPSSRRLRGGRHRFPSQADAALLRRPRGGAVPRYGGAARGTGGGTGGG
ncbi:unnamed protein product, partial [Pelagomonas calceolata]